MRLHRRANVASFLIACIYESGADVGWAQSKCHSTLIPECWFD
jgi:hypothetical protein